MLTQTCREVFCDYRNAVLHNDWVTVLGLVTKLSTGSVPLYLSPGTQPLSPPGQFLTLGVARTPGVFHVASYSCEFDLEGDEDDLRDHCFFFCFDWGRADHFLQHPGANLAFVCTAKGQYDCLVNKIPPIKRTLTIFLPICRRKLSAPVTSPRWQGLFFRLMVCGGATLIEGCTDGSMLSSRTLWGGCADRV